MTSDPADSLTPSSRRVAWLEAVFENLVDPILTIDEHGVVESANPAIEKVFGYTPEEVVGKSITTLMAQPHGEHSGPLQQQPGVGREVLGRRKDGSTFPMELAIREAMVDGRPLFTGVIRDLGQRWEEANLGRIVEDSLTEIFIFDARTWRFLQVNRGARENLGYSMNELRLLSFVDVAPEMTADSFSSSIEPLITGEQPKLEFQSVHQRKDGSRYSAEVHLQRSTYWGVSVLVANVLDVTERRQAEELMRVQQRAIEAASSGILITDPLKPDNPIVICNRAFLEMTGYTADEVMGMNCRFLQRDDRDQEAIEELRTAIAAGRASRVLLRNYRKDGTMFWNDLRISPVRDDQGQVTHFVGIQADVTERQETQKALKEILQEKSERLHAAESELVNQARLATLGQIFGGIAHEIRNPLNALKTSAYYLRNARRPAPDKTQEHLSRIDRQVTIIDNIVTALSDVARLPQPQLVPVPLGDWVAHAAGEVSLPHDVRVQVDLPTGLPEVLIDVNQVPIALKNLVRNARDAMPEGGTIKISAHALGDGTGQRVDIQVADTGVGIAPDEMSRIMEPLYSTKPKGMGLGLAISRAIVERNGGCIEVTSELGQGTTFTIRLRAATG